MLYFRFHITGEKKHLKWQEEEVEAMERHLRSSESPGKLACSQCKEKVMCVLRDRTWENIRSNIQNKIQSFET